MTYFYYLVGEAVVSVADDIAAGAYVTYQVVSSWFEA